MQKIISGILGIAITLVVVSSSAYAAFSDSVQVNGITVSSGNADLQVETAPSTFGDSWNTGLNLSGIFPGYSNSTTLTLKNNSSSAIALAITAQLTAATNWPNLADAVEVAVVDPVTTGTTGFLSLAQWNSAPVTFPGAAIAQGATKDYTVNVRVPTVYNSGPLSGQPVGNEIAGQTLSNITFTITGTESP